MRRLCTIGYQGVSAQAFVDALAEAAVDTLVDVRAVAWSRRPEFGKRALRDRLAAAGLAYRHEPDLGAPKALREQARSGDRRAFEAGYAAHLATRGALLERLLDELSGTAALMCMERDPADCHRRLVAEALERQAGLVAEHLFPGGARDAAPPAQGRLPLD